MRKLLLIVVLLSVPVLVAAGCGNSEEAASSASELAPAGAVMYGEATLHPKGDQKQAIDTILSKFPGGGQAGLADLIEKGLRESDAPISFKRDVEPWLGDEAAFFATGLGANGQLRASAGLIATEDEDKAQAALEKSAEGKTTKHTYNGVDYLTDESGEAGAVFDGFLVLGTEAGVKAAIDTSKGGDELSDDDHYTQAIDGATEDRLGLLYVNSPAFLKAARRSGSPLPGSFQRFLEQPVVATLDADGDGVLIEADVPDQMAKASGVLGQPSDLLNDLPGDSWLAVAQSELGKLLDGYVDAFAGVVGGRDAIEQQFTASTGLDLHKDVLDWMGDFGVFVRGTTVSSLDGALVVETSDEAASGRFLSALQRLAQSEGGADIQPRSGGFTVRTAEIPKPIEVFQQGGKVVFAYGDAAASDAVNPADKLGDSADFSAARDSLGDYDLSFFVLVKPILDLVDSTSAASDKHWQEARPYLEPLSALVGGSSGGDGDGLKSAAKLVVK